MDLFENNISTEEFDELASEYLADLKSANLEEERVRKREEFDQFRMAQMMSSCSELVVTSLPPPELPTPENAFSISSIQKTQGLIASDNSRAFLIFSSDSPIYFPKSPPTSNLTSLYVKSYKIYR